MHSHVVTSYRFLGGPIALHGLVHFLNTTGPSLTEVVYAYFDRISYMYSYIYIYYVLYIYIYDIQYSYIYKSIALLAPHLATHQVPAKSEDASSLQPPLK